MEKKYKILIICNTNIISGAERVLCDYLENNEEFEFFLYTNSSSYIFNNFKKYVKTKNIYTSKWVLTPLNLKKYPYRIVEEIYKLIINLYNINKIIKENDISLLYGNNSLDMPLLIGYKIINSKIPNISHIHDMLDKKELAGMVLSKFYKFIDCIIVPSNATKSKINQIINNKVKINVVYNSISNEKNIIKNIRNRLKILEKYKKEKKIIIAFIGSINERKDPKLFIKIIEALNKKHTNIQAIIAGKVLDKKIYTNICERIRMNKLPILYLGELQKEEISYLYKYIDILILTSKKDPLPTVILEAMNNNILVFSRNVDGVPEIIEDKVNGFLFDYADPIKQIIRKLQNILKLSEKQIICIKQNAKNTLDLKFSYDNKVKKINNLILSLIK